ncbi:unnamed protein product [Rotaria socialis]
MKYKIRFKSFSRKPKIMNYWLIFSCLFATCLAVAYGQLGFSTSTGRPISTTGRPISTTGSPISTTGRPISTTGRPISTTGRPISTTGSPISTTGRPISTTGRPASTTGSPISTTGRPVSTTGSPISTTGSPISTTGRPISTTGRPVSTTAGSSLKCVCSCCSGLRCKPVALQSFVDTTCIVKACKEKCKVFEPKHCDHTFMGTNDAYCTV